MKLDGELILELIEEGYLRMQKHPTKDLFILNYSQKTQFEKYWTPITLMCRGIVMDVDFNIVARPFPKFFNLSEHNKSDIPKGMTKEVFEKMDGSLGIFFHYVDEWIFASRGSFISEQAVKGGELMKGKNLDLLDKGNTYMFEIIY